MVLKKDVTLYERDEKGELLPQEVEVVIDEEDDTQLKFKGEKIIITPMPRGEIKRIFATVGDDTDLNKDIDGELIEKHCISPKYTKEEIPHIKPALAKILIATIFRESGLEPDSNKKKSIKRKEDEFGKN